MIRVFISYAHGSADRTAKVLALAQRLRLDGVDCRIDAFINGQPEEGWPLWMEREIESSNHVLIVCTERYLKRFMGEELPGTGLGVTWESQLTRSSLYASQGRQGKFVPVIFRKADQAFIPAILRYQATSYVLMDEYEKLLRLLSGQPEPKNVPVPVGSDDRLNGDDRFAESITRHMAALDRHVEKLTEEQRRAINQLRLLRRVRISGIAGSGKTLVAAEKAIRLAGAGQKTLFLCHNPMLAGHVSALTSGHPVDVAAFTKWAGAIAGAEPTSNSNWSKYDEPTSETLALAFDLVFASAPADRYDAVIIDEGQDFRDEWWPLVEAALREPNSGILYIFHDDKQALLPHRARYPFNEPIIDLSRNCRNAGRIYEIMRYIHPGAPPSDVDLRNLGDVFAEVSKPGYERESIRRALRWLPSDKLEHLTVLFAGDEAFTESIFNDLSIPVGRDVGWRDEVRRMFAHAGRAGHTLLSPSAGEVDTCLKGLSYDLRPSTGDVQLVQEVARRFVIRRDVRREILDSPDRREGLEWQLIGGRARLRARRKGYKMFASEIIMHFERDNWHAGLPRTETLQFTRDIKSQSKLTLPVYHVSEFKGLESTAVLLYIHSLGSMAEEELLVGISRARLLLAVVVRSQAESSGPASLRRLLRDIERRRSQADGQAAS
jgi:hypothetical protein